MVNDTIKTIIYNYNNYSSHKLNNLLNLYPKHLSIILIKFLLDKRNNYNIIEYLIKHIELKAIINDRHNIYEYSIFWHTFYDRLIDLITKNNIYFIESENIYNTLALIVKNTDVLNNKLSILFLSMINSPIYWSKIIRFINKTHLYGSRYGDIIFNIRDIIISNKKDLIFNDRIFLIYLIKKYNKYQKNMTKINKYIYITDIEGANNISLIHNTNIDCIVSMTNKHIIKISGIKYYNMAIEDNGSNGFIDITKYIIDDIIKDISNKKKILVHCFQGMSRSVSLVLLILIKSGMSFYSAWMIIKEKRELADPHPGFIKQIKEYIKYSNI